MSFTVIIATKQRPKKLLRCLSSIPAEVPVSIYATQASDIPEELAGRFVSVKIGTSTIVEAFNWLATQGVPEGDVLAVPDDVQFHEGFFQALTQCEQSHPEAKVIGVNVTNREHNNDAVTLVRRRVIKDRGFLFDPRFEHFFIDYEIGRYAKQRGTFHFCQEATLSHHHPGVSGEYDHTHNHRRMDKWRHDKDIWDEIRGKPRAPAPTTA